jgi:hypothetical protein
MAYVIKFAKLEVCRGTQRMKCIKKLVNFPTDITNRQEGMQMFSSSKAGYGNLHWSIFF